MPMKGSLLVGVLLAMWVPPVLSEEVRRDPAPDELPTHLIKVLRTTNKAQTNRYVPRVYSVSNVNPYSLFRWVNRTARIEEGVYHFFGKPEADGTVKSGKIVVAVPEYMVAGVDEMMRAIDTEGLTSSAGEVFFYFRPKHRSVADTGFTGLLSALSVAADVGSKVADIEANMFLVYDVPSGISDVKKFLPLIDAPPPQVMVEATVYEVQVDNEAKLGLDYVSWKNGPGRNAFALGTHWESGSGGTVGLPGSGFRAHGSNAAWFIDVPAAFFDYLVIKGKARVMTSAKICARNLIPATLTAADTILFYSARVGAAPFGGIRPVGLPLDPDGTSANYPDNRTVVGTKVDRHLAGETIGVKLEITPTIAENEIDLKVKVTVISHTGFDDKGTPVLVRRTADSQVRVRDGQEIVLGGYAREMFIERVDKVPILGSLPLIGDLFANESNTTERRQVVLVLTPHVVNDFSAMSYEPTKIDAALIRSKALREKALKVPTTEVGFDQWLLDMER